MAGSGTTFRLVAPAFRIHLWRVWGPRSYPVGILWLSSNHQHLHRSSGYLVCCPVGDSNPFEYRTCCPIHRGSSRELCHSSWDSSKHSGMGGNGSFAEYLVQTAGRNGKMDGHKRHSVSVWLLCLDAVE